MGLSWEGCVEEESSVVGQEGVGRGRVFGKRRNDVYGGTEAWRGIVWGMTMV